MEEQNLCTLLKELSAAQSRTLVKLSVQPPPLGGLALIVIEFAFDLWSSHRKLVHELPSRDVRANVFM